MDFCIMYFCIFFCIFDNNLRTKRIIEDPLVSKQPEWIGKKKEVSWWSAWVTWLVRPLGAKDEVNQAGLGAQRVANNYFFICAHNYDVFSDSILKTPLSAISRHPDHIARLA